MTDILTWWRGVLAPYIGSALYDQIAASAGATDPLHEIHGTSAGEDIIATGGAEAIFGEGGNDRIYALGGDDFLFGGGGNDLLDGGAGADYMSGGAGDDIYRVDNAGDVVNEETVAGVDDGGTDYVVSTISWTLGARLEKLELSGSADIDGAGNDLNNNVKGNGGANILYGGAGSDIIYGYAGDDVLIAGDGKDYLYGGTGNDIFVLAPEAGAWNKIYDYEAGDRIGIYADQYGLSEGDGLTGGVVDASRFVVGSTATEAYGQFLFTGSALLWDPDGTGAQGKMTLTLFSGSPTLTASDIVAYGGNASVSVAAVSGGPATETDHAAFFALRLTEALDHDVIVTVSTVDGSATGDQDFMALNAQEVLIKAGSTTAYAPIALLDDRYDEGTESFSLHIDGARRADTGAAVAVGTSSASQSIQDEGPAVVGNVFTQSWGTTDPSGIVYDPTTNTMLVCDSEAEETPFFRPENLFRVTLDGQFIEKMILPFTNEATGLALDESTNHLFISDDDLFKVFCVDITNPTQVLWEFDTLAVGGGDPEDVAFDPTTGHLFIVNGLQRTIVETDQHGTQVFDTIALPAEIDDPEAIAYNADEQMFYVGGGFSADIWKVDRNGAIVDRITTLEDARAEGTNHRVSVKDVAFAPASDGSGEQTLYVADYGWSHVDDGRMLELDLGDHDDPGWLLS